MINLNDLIKNFPKWLNPEGKQPWEVTRDLENVLKKKKASLPSDEYNISDGLCIHHTAIVEQGATLKGNIIISENCFIGAHAYLRGPIFLGKSVTVGPGCELKQSVILDHSTLAHFNYVGNSVVGKNVNFEAGAVCANHYNERKEKNIFIVYAGKRVDTQTVKFGSLVGDDVKIGANAVLSPGTILTKKSIVNRLELVDQTKV